MFKNLFKESVKYITIQYDSPTMVYRPGDIVKGNVIMQIEEPIKARRVVIYFVGGAHTYWTVRTSNHHTAVFSANELYANFESIVWHGTELSAGIYEYPFVFQLPDVLPPSYEGELGAIRYYVRAKIDRPLKIDDETCQVFSVIPQNDLNLVPNAGMSLMMDAEQELGCCCCKNGNVYAKIKVSKMGYVSGQCIVVTIHIQNDSTKDVTQIQTRLMEHSNFTAYEYYMGQMDVRNTYLAVFNSKEAFMVPQNSAKTYARKFRIPSVCPTFNNCSIIQAVYSLRVDIYTSSFWNGSIERSTPIIIGTVPVGFNSVQEKDSDEISAGDASAKAKSFKCTPVYVPSVFGPGIRHGSDSQSSGFVPKYIYYNDAE